MVLVIPFHRILKPFDVLFVVVDSVVEIGILPKLVPLLVVLHQLYPSLALVFLRLYLRRRVLLFILQLLLQFGSVLLVLRYDLVELVKLLLKGSLILIQPFDVVVFALQ